MGDFEERRARPLVMVVGMLGTKDSAGFLEPFAGMAQEVLAVPMQSQTAARPATEVARIARSSGIPATACESIEGALASIREREWETAPRVLICGSLYLAGEVLAANGTPPA